MIYDYASIWAVRIQPGFGKNNYHEALRRYYDALMRAGVNVDMIRPTDDFTRYRAIVAPDLYILPDAVARALSDYVSGGGVLVTDCRTGVKDETGLCHARTLPGLLSDALGIEIQEYEAIPDGTTYPVQGRAIAGTFTGKHYADWLRPTRAEALAAYTPWHMKRFAAATRHRFGQGTGYYVGTVFGEEAFYDALVADVLRTARVRPPVRPPLGVEASLRQGRGRRLLFLVNHAEAPREVKVPRGKRELISGERVRGAVRLGVFGVAVVEL
jgi:beta-galactosidase